MSEPVTTIAHHRFADELDARWLAMTAELLRGPIPAMPLAEAPSCPQDAPGSGAG